MGVSRLMSRYIFFSLKDVARDRSLAIYVVEVADCLHRVRVDPDTVERVPLLETLDCGQYNNELGSRDQADRIVNIERVFCRKVVSPQPIVTLLLPREVTVHMASCLDMSFRLELFPMAVVDHPEEEARRREVDYLEYLTACGGSVVSDELTLLSSSAWCSSSSGCAEIVTSLDCMIALFQSTSSY